MNKGWTTKPTAKSVKARLASKMCSGKWSEGVFQMAVKTAAFPKREARHIGALIAQMKKPIEDSVTVALSESLNSLLCSLIFIFFSEFSRLITQFIDRHYELWYEVCYLSRAFGSYDDTDKKKWLFLRIDKLIFSPWRIRTSFFHFQIQLEYKDFDKEGECLSIIHSMPGTLEYNSQLYLVTD